MSSKISIIVDTWEGNNDVMNIAMGYIAEERMIMQ